MSQSFEHNKIYLLISQIQPKGIYDFGYAGVVVLNCLYGMIAVMLFERYEKKNCPEYIISWGVVVFCILMGCFFNAFNTMLVWVIYICNKILLKR